MISKTLTSSIHQAFPVQKKIKPKEDVFICGLCDYKTKKEATLKKQITTNHEDNICKECKEKCPSFMKLLNHIVKHHHKETVKETVIKDFVKKDTENEQAG